MIVNIQYKGTASTESLLLLLFFLLLIIIETTAIWKCKENDSKVPKESEEVGVPGCSEKTGECDEAELHLIEIANNSNNSAKVLFQLGKLGYGIHQFRSDGRYHIGDVDLRALKCFLQRTVPDVSGGEEDFLQFTNMRLDETRTVSVAPNLAAIFYQPRRSCYWLPDRTRFLKLHFEPIKLEFSLELNCTPKDFHLPVKTTNSKSYTLIGKPGPAAFIPINYVTGTSFNLLPQNLKVSFDQLDINKARDLYNKLIGKITSVGVSTITGYNWTTFIPDNTLGLAFGPQNQQKSITVQEEEEVQNFQVVGECGPIRIYTNEIHAKIMNKVDKRCKGGTFLTADSCPLPGTNLPDKFPMANPPYWQP